MGFHVNLEECNPNTKPRNPCGHSAVSLRNFINPHDGSRQSLLGTPIWTNSPLGGGERPKTPNPEP